MVKVRDWRLDPSLFSRSSIRPHVYTVDPWRPRTPHSDDALGRKDTILRPFKLIPSTY